MKNVHKECIVKARTAQQSSTAVDSVGRRFDDLVRKGLIEPVSYKLRAIDTTPKRVSSNLVMDNRHR